MLTVHIGVSDDGLIREIRALGHASGKRGASLACGVASAALGSFGRWLLESALTSIQGAAPREGEFSLLLALPSADSYEKVLGASLFLQGTLNDLASDPASGIVIKMYLYKE